MNDTGTVCQSYISIAGYIESLLMLLSTGLICPGEQRLVFLVLQVFTGVSLQYFICSHTVFLISQLAQNSVKQCFSHIISIAVSSFYFCVFLIGVHAQSHVGRQCPGGGGPCQDVSILACYFKTCYSRTFFYIFISLSHLMAGQRSTASRAVRHDLKALVKQPFIPDGL